MFSALTLLVATSASPASASNGNVDWPTYLGDNARDLYSPLSQINRSNVTRLQVAWTYDTGDRDEYECNNLIVGGVLYTSSATRKIIALDAATGKVRWIWKPPTNGSEPVRGRQRGLAYWQNAKGGEGRIFAAAGNFLYALDAATGLPITAFGKNGAIHLGEGLGIEPPPSVGLHTPGVVFEDRLIIGGFNGPGAVRAIDVRTGRICWTFHLIPRPGEVGYETWPPGAYRTARGTMPWCGQSLDEKRGIVYVASKSADPGFYGATRHGMNLFANCLIALDARTGKRLWHHQLVHHDVLDRDLPCPPVLLTVIHEGRKRDVVAQGTKQGLLFVFDRVTGEPLWPIEERPALASDLPGEETWPTQPFPTKPAPLMRQFYTEKDASTISPEAHALTLERIRRSPSFSPFPAPSLKEIIIFPGFDGGMEWGGGAADPDGIYYVNINEIPWLLQMIEIRPADGRAISLGERAYLMQCAACHGRDRAGNPTSGFPSLLDIGKRKTRPEIARQLQQADGRMPAFDWLSRSQREAIIDYLLGVSTALDREGGTEDKSPAYASTGFHQWKDQQGYPAIAPPWGTLNAVDLNTGELKWKVPLGEYRELTKRGIPPTGTENYGGPLVTASGLIFIGATADETFRVFDRENGAILWQTRLPFGGNATPSTYMVNGRQFVVISAGGGKSDRPAGGMIVAFALPKTEPKSSH